LTQGEERGDRAYHGADYLFFATGKKKEGEARPNGFDFGRKKGKDLVASVG